MMFLSPTVISFRDEKLCIYDHPFKKVLDLMLGNSQWHLCPERVVDTEQAIYLTFTTVSAACALCVKYCADGN